MRDVAKNLTLALVSTLLFFGALELALGALEPWTAVEEGRQVSLFNPNDPERRVVTLSPTAAELLADSIVYHIRFDVFTMPDPELIFRVRPNPGGGPVFGYTGINAQGFRSRPLGLVEARTRVMLLSDSCGFGFGIRDHRQTLGFLLEKQLNEPDERYSVYNLSQPGYSSTQARLLLDRWLPVLRPHVVALYLGWNDLWQTRGLGDRQLLRVLRWTHSGPTSFLLRSHTYVALRAWIRRLTRPDPEADPVAIVGPAPRVPVHEAVENVRAMLEAARAAGAEGILIPPPWDSRRREPLSAMAPYAAALRAAFEGEVPLLALEPMRSAGAGPFFLRDGYHPSPRGAGLIASELAEHVRLEADRSVGR